MADGRLEIDRISKRYGDVVALRETTFDVRAGRAVRLRRQQRRRQDHDDAHRARRARRRRRRGRWDGEPITLETRRQIGYMPEERGLYPKMQVASSSSTSPGCTACPRRTPATEAWTERLGVADRRDDEVRISPSATSSACSSPPR